MLERYALRPSERQRELQRWNQRALDRLSCVVHSETSLEVLVPLAWFTRQGGCSSCVPLVVLSLLSRPAFGRRVLSEPVALFSGSGYGVLLGPPWLRPQLLPNQSLGARLHSQPHPMAGYQPSRARLYRPSPAEVPQLRWLPARCAGASPLLLQPMPIENFAAGPAAGLVRRGTGARSTVCGAVRQAAWATGGRAPARVCPAGWLRGGGGRRAANPEQGVAALLLHGVLHIFDPIAR